MTFFRKSIPFSAESFKVLDTERGTVRALVNTMGVVDADGDRIMPGAFSDSVQGLPHTPISVLWQHDPSNPIGKVADAFEVGRENGSTQLYTTMALNLATQRGRDAYEDLKFGSLQEWSVGFNVPADAIEIVLEDGHSIQNIKAVEWVEVSAVIRGASPDTGTVAIKELKRALPAHDTPTTAWETPWDAAAVVRALPDDSRGAYRRMFAYVESGANPDAKGSYKFPHHEWARAEDVGAANVRACTSGVAILNGGMGGADIPDADRRGIYRHLAEHIRASDREPPELKSHRDARLAKEVLGGDAYTTVDEARARSEQLGCSGAHEMATDDGTVWMPCSSHEEYVRLTEPVGANPISTYVDTSSLDLKHDATTSAAASVLRARLELLHQRLRQD